MRLLRLIEGGEYDEDTGEYTDPTSESERLYFYMETFHGIYTQGENKEADIVGVMRKLFKSCKGVEGDSNHERNWGPANFNITGTSYKDENEVLSGASSRRALTVEEWEALDVENV